MPRLRLPSHTEIVELRTRTGLSLQECKQRLTCTLLREFIMSEDVEINGHTKVVLIAILDMITP